MTGLRRSSSGQVVFTNDIGRHGLYGKLYQFFAPMYLLFYPFSKIAPEFFRYLFLESDINGTTFLPYQWLFFAVMTTVAPNYYFSLYVRHLHLFDTFVLQRLLFVGPAIILTLITRQYVYDDYHPLIAVFLVDVVGAIIHGHMSPDGWRGILTRFDRHFRNMPLTPRHRALRFESYMGLVHGAMSALQMSLTSDAKLATFTVTVAIGLQFVLIWYAAHDQSDVTTKGIMGARLFYLVGVLYLAEHLGFAVTNLRMHYLSLLLGAIWPYLGGIWSGFGILYSFYITYSKYIHVENGPLHWLIGWAFVVLLTSYSWRAMFLPYYDLKQKERLWRSNVQDVLLAAFMVGTGAVLTRTQTLGAGTVGEPVGYLLPLVTLWFTNETKLLNHNQVGTPFHPSWWVDGDVPKFAKSELLNITFGLGTALITVVLTSYAFYAISVSLGVEGIGLGEQQVWKFAGLHGITMILSSGLWMIVASSGVGAIGESKIFQPMVIPPLLRADPHDCIPVHKTDLMLGLLLLTLSAVAPKEMPPDQVDLIKIITMVTWTATILRKLYVHYIGWGYKEPRLLSKTRRRSSVGTEIQSGMKRLRKRTKSQVLGSSSTGWFTINRANEDTILAASGSVEVQDVLFNVERFGAETLLLRYDPMVIHVGAPDLRVGEKILAIAREKDLMESGLIVTPNRVTVVIRSSRLALAIPLSADVLGRSCKVFITHLVEQINKNIQENLKEFKVISEAIQKELPNGTSF